MIEDRDGDGYRSEDYGDHMVPEEGRVLAQNDRGQGRSILLNAIVDTLEGDTVKWP